MDTLKRLEEILARREMSYYQLSKISGVPASTLSNMRRRGTTLTIPTLVDICDSLDIPLSQFFIEDDLFLCPVTPDQKQIMDYFILLSTRQQHLILQLVKELRYSK